MAFLKSITDCSIGEYVSCIKVKGVPILPPLVSIFSLTYFIHTIGNLFMYSLLLTCPLHTVFAITNSAQ